MGQAEPPMEPPFGDDWWPEADTVGLIGTPDAEYGGDPGDDRLAESGH